jgi:hypothetical protein
MSSKNGQTANKQVIDEEGTVDSKIKDTIIQARNRVEKAFYQVNVKNPLEDVQTLPKPKRDEIYAKTVRQFLLRIEPLLTADSIQGNEAYYNGLGEPIASFGLVPPDTEGHKLSLVTLDKDEKTLRRMMDLPRGVELPEPKTITFEGLQDIIEKPLIVSHQWEVCVAKSGARPNWDYIYPHEERLVPREVYRDALRQADQFLQEIGIGVETGLPEVDDVSDQPY